jgi:hypothetical protein
MPRSLAISLKFFAIVFTPIAVIGFVLSKTAISGDQYAAVLELFGNDSRAGAIQIIDVDVRTISSLLDFFGTWSLPALVAIVLVGIALLIVSNDRIASTWHICLGLFFSFGIWAIFLAKSRPAIVEIVGSDISNLSAQVITAFLSHLSEELLNLTGILTLVFGALALGFWVLAARLKASANNSLN